MMLHYKEDVRMKLAVVALSFACMCVSCATTGSVRISPWTSENSIRQSILAHTPLNSSIETVLTFVNSRMIRRSYHSVGSKPPLAYYETHVSEFTQKRELRKLRRRFPSANAVGYISVPLGYYGVMSQTQVIVNWFFNDGGRLLDVVVLKLDCPL